MAARRRGAGAARCRGPRRSRGADARARRARHQRAARRGGRASSTARCSPPAWSTSCCSTSRPALHRRSGARHRRRCAGGLAHLADRVPLDVARRRRASATTCACVARVVAQGGLMFTGIVQAVGTDRGASRRRAMACASPSTPGALDVADVADRRQHRGQRLLPDRRRDRAARRSRFDVSAETLRCTPGLDRRGRRQPREGAAPRRPPGRPPRDRARRRRRHGDALRARSPDDRLGTAAGASRSTRRRRSRASSREGLDRRARREPHGERGRTARAFHVNLIPHTLAVTTLTTLAPGAHVNLEVDLVARYVARLADADADPVTRTATGAKENQWT